MLSQKQILTLFMIRNSQKNTLSDLAIPKELLIFEIGRYSVNMLLEYIIHNNYYEMAKMLRENPVLMFYTGTAKDLDGQMITTTPFGYALKFLDTYAWKLCYAIALEDPKNKNIYLRYFQDYARNFKDCIDLITLKVSYDHFLKNFDLYNAGQCTLEKLKKAWLEVGKAQRYHTPRHMLREMSALNPNLDMIKRDLVLLTADPHKDLTLECLKKISKNFNNCPILINKKRVFEFYRWTVLQELHCFETRKLPFKHIAFPEEPNIPILKKMKKEDSREFFDYYGPWQNLYTVDLNDYIPLKYSTVDIIYDTGQVEENAELKFSDLGDKYTLTRGAAMHWIGSDIALGLNKMLNHRAAHDLRNFGNLASLRLEERRTFFEEVLEINLPKNETSVKLIDLKKMKIK